MITLYRKAHFNAAHRLYRPDWGDAKNRKVFGMCSNPHYHGHNYELEVGISGEINAETGYLIDLKDVKQAIEEEVEDAFDHKNLNEEVPEFKDLNPTVENIAVVIWNKLRKRFDDSYGLSVTLYETPRNYVTYSGE